MTPRDEAERLAAPALDPKEAFRLARAAYEKDPNNERAAIDLGRTCFDLAHAAESRKERARYAELGVQVTREAAARHTNSAGAFYYLGLNYAQLARARTIAALGLLEPLEQALVQARRLDPTYDYAGADRALGMLYRDAPGWTVGDRERARECLERAVATAPVYPENHLELCAAYLAWRERAAARKQLSALEEVLPKAREALTGPRWGLAWKEWDSRLESLKKRLPP